MCTELVFYHSPYPPSSWQVDWETLYQRVRNNPLQINSNTLSRTITRAYVCEILSFLAQFYTENFLLKEKIKVKKPKLKKSSLTEISFIIHDRCVVIKVENVEVWKHLEIPFLIWTIIKIIAIYKNLEVQNHQNL